MSTSTKYYRPSTKWDSDNPLLMLIIVQAMFFIILNVIKSVYAFSRLDPESFYRNIYYWSVLSSDPEKFLTRPWTFLTMQFSEVKLILVIGNLIWTWMFGYLIQDLVGGEKIFPVFMYSSFFSGIFFILVTNILKHESVGVVYFSGVIPGILGLASAATTLAPKYKIFPLIGGGIPLWIIALIYMLLNVSTSGGMLPFIPALVGILVGFGYVQLMQRGFDPGAWMVKLHSKVVDFCTPNKKKHPREEIFYNTSVRKPFVKKPNHTQKRVDQLLDKIHQFGYEQLTQEEKDFLNQASKKEL